MQFSTKQHQTYCGIDLHARTMYVCILNQAGDILGHQNMPSSPDALLRTMAPDRDDIVVAVEWVLTWYGLADLCAREGMPFVLGPALYRKALHGGKATNAKSDAHKIAGLLRGGMLPPASGSPAAMRATRDLLRRRMSRTRQRAELWAHIQNTTSQDTLPEIGKKLADKATRDGVAERCPDPAVPKSIAVAWALLGDDEALLRALALHIVQAAKQHDAHTWDLLQTGPGIGHMLSLVLVYEIHDIQRCPSVQDFVSYCRLVKCATESAGTRYGTAGAKSGNTSRKWAFSEAAVLLLRDNPAGQKSLTRLEKQHGQGNALTRLAQQLGRAVSDMGKRHKACDLPTFLQA